MQRKFKVIIVFLFLVLFTIQGQEKMRDIALVMNMHMPYSEDALIVSSYLKDIAETKVINTYDSIILKKISGDIDSTSLKKVINFIFSRGISAFYYITVKQENNFLHIDLKLYNSVGSIIYEYVYVLYISNENDFIVSERDEKKWLDIISNSLDHVLMLKDKINIEKKMISRSFKFEHDFPFFSIGVNALSGKIYFDNRMNARSQKLFSVFPVDIKLKFFPLKYLEVGVFTQFDYNNMVYRYLDNNKYYYYDSGFSVFYGVMAGLSFFKENSHYSIGIQFYNMYYDISERGEWNKPYNLNSNFLPQFSLYQELSIKIFNFFYFSIFFRFKTLPLFYLNGSDFISQPFHYDFFTVEITFAGLSIII